MIKQHKLVFYISVLTRMPIFLNTVGIQQITDWMKKITYMQKVEMYALSLNQNANVPHYFRIKCVCVCIY